MIPAEYQFGTHAEALYNAEALKSRIRASALAPIIGVALGTFISVPQQTYANVAPVIQPSVVAGKTPGIGRYVTAAPQSIEFVSPVVRASAFAGNTPGIGRYVVTGDTPFQLPAQIWPAVLSPPAVSAQPLRAQYASPQLIDLTVQAVINHSAPGSQGPTVRAFVAGPQVVDLTVPAVISRSVAGFQGPTVRSYSASPQGVDLTLQAVYAAPLVPGAVSIVRSYFVAPEQIDLNLKAVLVGSSPGQQGPTVRSFSVPPENRDLSQPVSVRAAVFTPVALITGPTVYQYAVPPQPDLNVNFSVTWTPSTFSPSAPTPPPLGAAGNPRRKRYGVIDGTRLLIFATQSQATAARRAIESGRISTTEEPIPALRKINVQPPIEVVPLKEVEQVAQAAHAGPQFRRLLKAHDSTAIARQWEHWRAREEEDIARAMLTQDQVERAELAQQVSAFQEALAQWIKSKRGRT